MLPSIEDEFAVMLTVYLEEKEVTTQDIHQVVSAYVLEHKNMRIFSPTSAIGSSGIFGDERKELVKYLEDYYKITLTDSNTVVYFSELYESVLDEIKNKVINYIAS
jgi:hypothetical protein